LRRAFATKVDGGFASDRWLRVFNRKNTIRSGCSTVLSSDTLRNSSDTNDEGNNTAAYEAVSHQKRNPSSRFSAGKPDDFRAQSTKHSASYCGEPTENNAYIRTDVARFRFPGSGIANTSCRSDCRIGKRVGWPGLIGPPESSPNSRDGKEDYPERDEYEREYQAADQNDRELVVFPKVPQLGLSI